MKIENIIAVTACLRRCSLAISYEGAIYEDNQEIDSCANLAWLVESMIKKNNICLSKMDMVITSSGPGSFTGIRAAQSFAKGMALSLKIPSKSLSYFDIIHSNYLKKNVNNGVFLVVIKSEKNQAYYRLHQDGSDEESRTGVLSFENFRFLVEKNKKIVLLGDAIGEIIPFLEDRDVSSFYMSDFRDAKYFLKFSDLFEEKSKIEALYINASVK